MSLSFSTPPPLVEAPRQSIFGVYTDTFPFDFLNIYQNKLLVDRNGVKRFRN